MLYRAERLFHGEQCNCSDCNDSRNDSLNNKYGIVPIIDWLELKDNYESAISNALTSDMMLPNSIIVEADNHDEAEIKIRALIAEKCYGKMPVGGDITMMQHGTILVADHLMFGDIKLALNYLSDQPGQSVYVKAYSMDNTYNGKCEIPLDLHVTVKEQNITLGAGRSIIKGVVNKDGKTRQIFAKILPTDFTYYNSYGQRLNYWLMKELSESEFNRIAKSIVNRTNVAWIIKGLISVLRSDFNAHMSEASGYHYRFSLQYHKPQPDDFFVIKVLMKICRASGVKEFNEVKKFDFNKAMNHCNAAKKAKGVKQDRLDKIDQIVKMVKMVRALTKTRKVVTCGP